MTSGELKLAGRGAEWYAKWLLHGLRTVDLGQDPGYVPAFAGAESMIYPDKNGIVSDLAVIRERLDVSARNDFDDGVTEAVQSLDLARHEDVVLAKQLARLASLVGNRRAVHKLAFCLDPVRSDEDAYDLNVEIVSAIVANPYRDDKRSKEALYRLARSASFRGNRAPQVLRTLCIAAPVDLVGHLVLLNQFLAPMYAPEKLLENDVRRSTACELVKDIYTLVDAAIFVAAAEGWATRCTPVSGYGQSAFMQDWFVSLITENQNLQPLAEQAYQIWKSELPAADSGPNRDGSANSVRHSRPEWRPQANGSSIKRIRKLLKHLTQPKGKRNPLGKVYPRGTKMRCQTIDRSGSGRDSDRRFGRRLGYPYGKCGWANAAKDKSAIETANIVLFGSGYEGRN